MNEAKKLAVVTGGAGFVGSHLCERLVKEGYRVISLDNYFTGSPENHVPGVDYRTGHTKDISSHVSELPEILFHLGEYARTEKSFEEIDAVWDLNKQGTFAVLEFWRKTKCKLVYAGSSTKFADAGDGRNQSPYAWTKASNTELVVNYARWFGLRYAVTYFYNVYGPREMSGPYGTLIRIFTELKRNGQPLTVVSPGTQRRNFTHVADIVEGLYMVGERGEGDGFGIGSDESHSVLEVAEMFKGEVLMMPERAGNRLSSHVENIRTKSLGWSPKFVLSEYVRGLPSTEVTNKKDERILVFSTTFLPNAGKAEEALVQLMRAMPNIHFDVITTVFSVDGKNVASPLPNVTIHRVGYGNAWDKYLLPIWGARIAQRLMKEHSYLFSWALFASYGALAALFSRRKTPLPILITIADQKLTSIPFHVRILLGHILGRADQIYADTNEARSALALSKREGLIKSIGRGDAFANQLRFAYSTLLRKHSTL